MKGLEKTGNCLDYTTLVLSSPQVLVGKPKHVTDPITLSRVTSEVWAEPGTESLNFKVSLNFKLTVYLISLDNVLYAILFKGIFLKEQIYKWC